MRLRLLGALSIDVDEDAPRIQRKASALLAYLASPLGAPHTRDELCSLLWGNREEAISRHNLRQSLSHIRSCLGPAQAALILSNDETVKLARAGWSTDVEEFEGLACKGSVEALEHAVCLYRGEFLRGLCVGSDEFETWLRIERARLKEMALKILKRLAVWREQSGDISDAILLNMRMLAVDPLNEPAHRRLIALLAKEGRKATAARQLGRMKHMLADELGIDPKRETRDLEATVYGASLNSRLRHGSNIRRRVAVAPIVCPDLVSAEGASAIAFWRALKREMNETSAFEPRIAPALSLLTSDVSSGIPLHETLNADWLLECACGTIADALWVECSLTSTPDQKLVWTDRRELCPAAEECDAREIVEAIGDAVQSKIDERLDQATEAGIACLSANARDALISENSAELVRAIALFGAQIERALDVGTRTRLSSRDTDARRRD